MTKIKPRKLKFYGLHNIDQIPQLKILSKEELFAMKVVSTVLPFRTNNYVIEELIDWKNIPEDPIYQLTFMQKEMLEPQHFESLAKLLRDKSDETKIQKLVNEIRRQLNPHPAGQMTANVPKLDEERVQGLQHKYRETCLVFPSAGQTCFAYCTFCFRWPQFIGMHDLKFAARESGRFQEYLKQHKEVTDLLLTGGDPMVMSAQKLSRYIEPFLGPEFEHIQNIRIGTKALAYWPYRYITDKDSDEVLRLYEKVVKAGKHLSIMAHYNHWQELETEVSQEAIRRIRMTGAEIRTQSPLLNHINNSAAIWAKMWKKQVQLGCIPYYMFVERDTGPKSYFEVPLFQSYTIFRQALQSVSGLARTVRGPSMSALPGKVVVEGVVSLQNQKMFVLSLLQGRNPEWCKKPFFAKFDPKATWLEDLKPIDGKQFFYEEELKEILAQRNYLPSPCEYLKK